MASKAKKKYSYHTKALLVPDGTRKYIRAKSQEEPDEKAANDRNTRQITGHTAA